MLTTRPILTFLSAALIQTSLAQTVVTTTNDAGSGSLREAIENASPGESITFQASLSAQSITLTSGQLLVDKSLTIDASALPGGITIDGNGDGTPGSSRVLEIGPHGGAIPSADILFVTSANYVGEGAAGAPDAPYTDLLMANGHQVTRWASHDDPTPADAVVLNAADLIILGRTVNSNHYRQDPEAEFWNETITTPILNLSGFTTRRVRLGWTENQTITDADGDIGLYRIEEPHPIFAGFPWENEEQEPIDVAYARLLDGQRGVSFNMHRPVGGRTIAAVATEGSVKNGPAITEYFPGAVLARGTPRLVLAGHRMAFLTGSREAEVDPTLPAGQYDLTPDGETLFLNCVRYLSDPATVTLDSLKVTGGNRALAGGGILNNGAKLTLNRVTITGNDANDGGGIQTVGMLTMNQCVITDNSNQAGARSTQGGGIANYGRLILNNCLVAGNGKDDAIGGGLKNGMTGITTINRSTFKDNTADRGAGIFNNGALDLNNTTISRNDASESGGGIFNFGKLWEVNGVGAKGAELAITHTTIARNTADSIGGGGIQNSNNGAITLNNAIVASNSSDSGIGPDIRYLVAASDNPISIVTEGVSLLSDPGASTLTASSTLLIGDPMLGSLTNNNGGFTPTMALLTGSPAIDTANSTPFANDQRGFPRPLGAGPDIGAYESGETSGYATWSASLPAGADISFDGDADTDGFGNGAEYALGTNGSAYDSSSTQLPSARQNALGDIEITFGYEASAAADTAWILKRSVDWSDYVEVYRYDGPSDTESLSSGITANHNGATITVTDEAQVETRLFYQFIAEPSS